MQYKKPLLAAGVLFSITTINAQAQLSSIDNGLGVYDSALNATWTSDANLLGTMENTNGYNTMVQDIIKASPVVHDTPNSYDNGGSGIYNLSASDFHSGGTVDWWAAQAFVNYLNSTDYGNSTHWALPTSDAVVGYNDTGSQLGELFYNELGGTSGNAIPSSNHFTNEQDLGYWSGTEYASGSSDAWYFNNNNGLQFGSVLKYNQNNVWLVSPGDVVATTAVPEPGMVWLFLTGIGLLNFKRRDNIGR
ncbi:MAG: DUF1566 domain-containing protein [Methylomonas sp.]|jgi:hypothetical protein